MHFAGRSLNGTLRHSPVGAGDPWVRGTILFENGDSGSVRRGGGSLVPRLLVSALQASPRRGWCPARPSLRAPGPSESLKCF